jgi:methionine-rich copper-binding protein CopC
MRTLKLAFVTALAIAGLPISEAAAHAQLDHASPAVGSTVSGSPGSVTLYFTEKLEPKFSGGEVRSAAGARVDHGASVSGNVMRLGVGALAPGSYSVKWHVLSVDTHKTQGSFSFTVGK